MKSEELSNNKFVLSAIFGITFVSFCAFLIGYGINQGECPVCKEKEIIKTYITTNIIDNDIDYNMTTSTIRKDLIGKYVSVGDSKSYFEIEKNGDFNFNVLVDEKYITYTNEDYVLLLYYFKDVANIVTPTIETLEPNYIYKINMTLIPKNKIDDDTVKESIISFVSEESNKEKFFNFFEIDELGHISNYILESEVLDGSDNK